MRYRDGTARTAPYVPTTYDEYAIQSERSDGETVTHAKGFASAEEAAETVAWQYRDDANIRIVKRTCYDPTPWEDIKYSMQLIAQARADRLEHFDELAAKARGDVSS